MINEIKSIFWKEGSHYVAQCLNIDVLSFGNNKDEALKNQNEAIELYKEDASVDYLNKKESPEIIYAKIERAIR